MNGNQDKFRSLLKRWRDIDPPTNFEANVWRRIRATRTEPVSSFNWIDLIGSLLWQRSWSVAITVTLAVAVGIWGGIVSVPHRPDSARAELQFLAPGTLAGSYLQMAAKETR